MRWFKRHECPKHLVGVPDPKAWSEGYEACLTITKAFGKKAARDAASKPAGPVSPNWGALTNGLGTLFPSVPQIRERNRRSELARAEASLAKAVEDAEFKARVLAALEDK